MGHGLGSGGTNKTCPGRGASLKPEGSKGHTVGEAESAVSSYRSVARVVFIAAAAEAAATGLAACVGEIE